MKDTETLPVPCDATQEPQSLPVSRRKLMAYAISAPVLTVASGFGINLAAPATAQAQLLGGLLGSLPPLALTPPDTVDYYDLGDAIAQTSLPTMPLVKLTIGTDSRVRLELPRMESGQGIDTTSAMMVAEELDVPTSMVDVVLSDARPELVYNQLTGGSTSVRALDLGLPVLAAVARARLLSAAAIQFGTSPADLTINAGVVLAPGGFSATLGSLSSAAAALPLPVNALRKSASQYRIIGTRTGRIDARAIVTGQKKFTMDQDVPNAKPTMMRMPSQVRGTVVSVNNLGTVRGMPGVLEVVVVPPGGSITPRQVGVAVMAETFGQAWAACNALDITWGDGPVKGESDATIQAKLRNSILPFAVPPLGALTVEGEFEMAAASHAPLEVDCAIVDVRADRAEIWAGLQSPIVTQQAIAIDLGLPQNAVTTHVIPSGGSFGRRLFWDPVQSAAYISQVTGRICKLMYHRSDDVRHGRMRPHQYQKIRATLLDGRVISYQQRGASPNVDTRHGLGEIFSAIATSAPAGTVQTGGNLGVELSLFKTMVTSPYNFGVHSKELMPTELDLNTCSFRSVHIQPFRATEEIMVDEIARALNQDPLAFRLKYLRLPRARAVLEKVAQVGNWGRAMPAGFAQGIAVHMETRAFTATLVEIDCRDPLRAKVVKAVIAIDVGRPINPSGIEAQMQGGLSDSISLILNAGLTFKNGLPQQSSYANYRFSQIKDFPKDVQIIIIPNEGEIIAGLGEVGFSASSGAIANAYARATGLKPRKFPLNAQPAYTPVAPGKLPDPVFIL
ncbi:MAG: molybdopterin cofactor-binding domain-containing protein [Burkholderiales bacterium]